MSKTATVNTNVKIDINPDGVILTLPGLDEDLAKLLKSASNFTVQPLSEHSFDTSDVVITSDRRIEFVDKDTE